MGFAHTFALGMKSNFQGALLKLRSPTLFTSNFVVDTILGQLNWTDNLAGSAEYEVYSSTNAAPEVLLATTIAGATSFQDTTCKQNAIVLYRIRAKQVDKFSNFAATIIQTPLCWKTNQSSLGTVTINALNIVADKTVTVNWGDGSSQAYTGNNSSITKNYAAIGQYNVWLTGDTSYITSLMHYNQSKSYGLVTNWILHNLLETLHFGATGLTGVVTNWVLPATMTSLVMHLTGITGIITNWILPSSMISFSVNTTAVTGVVTNWVLPAVMNTFLIHITGLSGSLPQITAGPTNAMNYQARICNISDSNTTIFREGMVTFDISAQKVAFPTVNIDKQLKSLADWYQVNAPTANCTINMSGANMGIPTGGSSNADLVRLVGYYTAVSKSCTVLVRTS